MENFFAQFLNTYGVAILYALLTALAGVLANGLKRVYTKYINDKTKQTVAKVVVMAVQQLYAELDGPEKFDFALQSMTEMLNEKGIQISTLEARMLIEAAVGEFKDVFSRNEVPEDDEPAEDIPIEVMFPEEEK